MASGSCAADGEGEGAPRGVQPRTHPVLVDEGRALGTERIAVPRLRCEDWTTGMAAVSVGGWQRGRQERHAPSSHSSTIDG